MSTKRRPADDAQSLVSEAMQGIVAEAATKSARGEADALEKARRDRRKRVFAAVLLPTALVLTLLNLGGFLTIEHEIAPPPPAVVLDNALLVLSDAVDELEDFHAANGHYPERPGFVGPSDGDDDAPMPFSYQLIGQARYTVTLTIDGHTMTYDSLKDADTFFADVR